MNTNGKLTEVLSRMKGVRKSGKGWKSLCPAHKDQNPSLSISEGEDGRVLLRCFADCSVDEICAAVNLTSADLFEPSTAFTSTVFGSSRAKRQNRRQGNGDHKAKGKPYATARGAVAALDSVIKRNEQGRRVGRWNYTDAAGEPLAIVVRYDLPTPDGEKQRKTFRPVSKHGDGWRLCDPSGQWPLFSLPNLAEAKRVYIVEGEKCAELARSIGLTATTSAHGAKAAEKTDWTPLDGKECVIVPDCGDAGGQYADAVAAILTTLTPPAKVKAIELPGMQNEGDDIEQFINARRGAGRTDEQILAEIEALSDEAEPIAPIKPTDGIDRYRPFPTDALPQPIRGFVVAGAKAIGCDPSYLALPLLTGVAAAIGNTRRLQLKQGWCAPPILWTAIVGESGTTKTPAFKLAMRALRERQAKAIQQHTEAMKQHQIDLAVYAVELEKWKSERKQGVAGDPPEKPDEPQAERCIVGDTTVEALAPLLLANPRGLLLQRDELAGWIGSFDRYTSGKGGADASHWLSMHNAENIIVDRKTGSQRTIFIPQASVCVTGGIQPTILNKVLGIEHRESGLAARLLLCCPPRRVKHWTEAVIDPVAENEIADLIERLCGLQPTTDHDGNARPVIIGLTPEAKQLWKGYYNAHGQEQIDLTGDLSAAWSKLEEYAARLALVIHLVRCAAEDWKLTTPDAVDAESMGAGITLVQWFKHETKRVYAILAESDEGSERRKLIEWIERKGDRIEGKGYAVTARETQQGCRWLATSEEAEAALQDLAKAGCGYWEPAPPGRRGQPTRRFILSEPSTVYGNTTNLNENGNTVDVDSVDDHEKGWL